MSAPKQRLRADNIKFAVYTIIPDVMPFFKRELRNTS